MRSSIPPVRALLATLSVLSVGALLLAAAGCTPMSNRGLVASAPHYRGIQRVAVLLRPWPTHRQLPGQPRLDSDFITADTPFFAPLEPRREPEPRAVDLAGLDEMVVDTVMDSLRSRGYEPILLSAGALVPSGMSVGVFLSRQRHLTPEVDAYLFGFYTPALYVARPERVPVAAGLRSYTLEEVTRHLNPGRGVLLWAGPAAPQAPPFSISHAVIHLSLALFRASDGRPLWQVADSRITGHPRGIVANCPPFPSRENYWTGPEVIRRLMRDNLRCRLHFLLPDAIPPSARSDFAPSMLPLAAPRLFPHNRGAGMPVKLFSPGNSPCS